MGIRIKEHSDNKWISQNFVFSDSLQNKKPERLPKILIYFDFHPCSDKP